MVFKEGLPITRKAFLTLIKSNYINELKATFHSESNGESPFVSKRQYSYEINNEYACACNETVGRCNIISICSYVLIRYFRLQFDRVLLPFL